MAGGETPSSALAHCRWCNRSAVPAFRRCEKGWPCVNPDSDEKRGTVTTAIAPLSSGPGRVFWQEPLFPQTPVPVPAVPVAYAETKTARPRAEAAAARAAGDFSHTWVVAAEIQVESRIASIADFRGSFKAAAGQRVEALEVYCRGCRKPYEGAKGQDCEEKVDNRHLIGGDQSVRKKRKVPPAPRGATLVPGMKVQRRGIHAYIAGVSRPR
jgi:hypothetical protein